MKFFEINSDQMKMFKLLVSHLDLQVSSIAQILDIENENLRNMFTISLIFTIFFKIFSY